MQSIAWISAAKKRLMLIAAIGLATPAQFVFTTPAVAATPPGASNVQFCKFFQALGLFPGNDLGACIAEGATTYNLVVTGRSSDLHGAAVVTCKGILDQFPESFYQTWDSIDQCVADYAGIFGP